MKAAICGERGLAWADVAPPTPGPDDVLVRVRTCALNRADLGMLAGRAHGTAGGPGTVFDAIVANGRLQRGETVLIQGASSGVGLMGLQIARLMGAGKVIGTSTGAARRARPSEYGADLALDSADPAWPQRVLDATGGHGADLVIDQLAGTTVNQSMAAAALGARIVNVGRLAGMRGGFDFDLHARKRIRCIGVTFRTRTVEQVRKIQAGVVAHLWQPLVDGKLSLPIDSLFPFERLGEAFERMRSNGHFGKIVVALPA